ncbi:MAG: hypothetical protein AAGF92_17810 [Myxococcota bacterium]
MSRRFARQLLLGEIGEAGQGRLFEAGFCAGESTDPDAYAVASEYLRRAGCPERSEGTPLDALSADAVSQLAAAAGTSRALAAAILGALEAVEHIKRALPAGRPLGTGRAPLSKG